MSRLSRNQGKEKRSTEDSEKITSEVHDSIALSMKTPIAELVLLGTVLNNVKDGEEQPIKMGALLDSDSQIITTTETAVTNNNKS